LTPAVAGQAVERLKAKGKRLKEKTGDGRPKTGRDLKKMR